MGKVDITTKKNPATTYYDYLNEIGFGKKNVVIEYATSFIKRKCKDSSGSFKVADIGCFNGVMLSEIYKRLPAGLHKKLEFFGYDCDQEMLLDGSKRYPYINFFNYNLNSKPPVTAEFDLIILSNVLHELYSKEFPNRRRGTQKVDHALTKLNYMLKRDGCLLLIDGLTPKGYSSKVQVGVKNKSTLAQLQLFKKSDYFKPINFRTRGEFIEISLGDLAIFLTKAKYLKRGFWPLEAKQSYQYFTKEDFQRSLNSTGFRILEFLPQLLLEKEVCLTITYPTNLSLPAKNVLILAQRV